MKILIVLVLWKRCKVERYNRRHQDIRLGRSNGFELVPCVQKHEFFGTPRSTMARAVDGEVKAFAGKKEYLRTPRKSKVLPPYRCCRVLLALSSQLVDSCGCKIGRTIKAPMHQALTVRDRNQFYEYWKSQNFWKNKKVWKQVILLV